MKYSMSRTGRMTNCVLTSHYSFTVYIWTTWVLFYLQMLGRWIGFPIKQIEFQSKLLNSLEKWQLCYIVGNFTKSVIFFLQHTRLNMVWTNNFSTLEDQISSKLWCFPCMAVEVFQLFCNEIFSMLRTDKMLTHNWWMQMLRISKILRNSLNKLTSRK